MKRVYSFYLDAARIAVSSIFAHKLRAFLTLIGIIIGVASVVTVGASISGLNYYVTDKISKVLGSNHFMIARMAFSNRLPDDEFERINRRNKTVTWEDYEAVKANCRTCAEIGAMIQNNADMSQNGIDFPSVQVFGSTANMAEIEDKTVDEGRFFTADEVQRSAHVMVVGVDIRDKFFPDGNSLGKVLKVQGIPMTIVGVEEKGGAFFGESLDRHLFIPVTTAQQIFGRGTGLQIHGMAKNRDDFQATIDDARLTMRNQRKLIGTDEDDFGLVDVQSLNNQIDGFTGAIAGVVIPITLITLIVGGIVVMNIMLVSVTERTFEVGLRKALGASKKQILMQFLIEASTLCIFGGIMGLVLAAAICKLITILAGITMSITLGYILLAIIVSTLIGVVAGMYPAYKAARLDPIVALAHV
jgi:putative ABC transport system permease protein